MATMAEPRTEKGILATVLSGRYRDLSRLGQEGRSRMLEAWKLRHRRSLLQRVRLMFCAMSLAALTLSGEMLEAGRVGTGILCVLALAGLWTITHLRNRVSWASLVVEAGVMFVLVGSLSPTDRGLTPVYAGVLFHILHGSLRQGLWATGLFLATFLGGNLGRNPLEIIAVDSLVLLLYAATMFLVRNAIHERDLVVRYEQALRGVAARLMTATQVQKIHWYAIEATAAMLPEDQACTVRIVGGPEAAELGEAPPAQVRLARMGRKRQRLARRHPAVVCDVPLTVGGRPRGAMRIETPVPLDEALRDSLQLLASFVDLALERVEHLEEIRRNARLDPLTGLLNRAGFYEHLVAVRARTRRSGLAYAMVAIDLDDFKGVNDTFGHSAGDLLLCTVAERLRSAVREGEAASRMGGDEFVVVLQEVDDRQAERAGERLLAAIAKPLTLAGQRLSLRASVGIATDSGHAEPDELLHRADEAMYEAKRSGRFCVRLAIATEEQPVPQRPRRLASARNVARSARAASA